MPLPLASFTRTKWLGFFAELTAKLTHHNVLVVIEGCEMLKRVLMTRISIVAVLQEGDLLAHFVNTLVGGLQGERSHGAVLELNEELTYTQLDTLSFCVDLMVSVHADGDAYDKLLVAARAGPMVEALLEALQRLPKPFFGLLGRLLQSLLRLPLGRPVPEEFSEAVVAEGLHTVVVQKHLEELRQLCGNHGPLLQDAVDGLTLLVSTTDGARRFCTMALLNVTKKRLRKYRLRHKNQAEEDETADGEGAETTTNTSASPGKSKKMPSMVATAECGSQFTRDADFEVELDEHLAQVNLSTAMDAHMPAADEVEDEVDASPRQASACAPPAALNRTGARPSDSGSAARTTATATTAAATSTEGDVSALVDREPSEVPFELPAYLVDTVLSGVASARSHADFFSQLDDLWCLVTADVSVVSRQLTGGALSAIERFLTVAPNTRQDRLLFVSLLQWTGHVLGATPLTEASARAVLLRDVSVALWQILAADLQARETEDAAQRSARATQHHLFMPSRRAAQQRDSTDDGAAAMEDGDPVPADLLPYAMARRTVEELRLQPPSMAVTILNFFLCVEHGSTVAEVECWLRPTAAGGDAWGVMAGYLQRVMQSRSVLLDAPTTVDGALSEELYLNWSLKGALTDDITVATLSSKLVASLTSRRQGLVQPAPTSSSSLSSAAVLSPEALRAALARLAPLLMHIGIQNPTLTCASVGDAASALYYCPANPHATRYTSLGEATLVALEACVALVAALPVVESDTTTSPTTSLGLVRFVLPALPALLRVTRDSLHAAVRAVPYRLLAHTCRTAPEVEAVFATVPSIWRSVAASVLRCGTSASQWETGAAADWLTRVLVEHGARLTEARAAAAAAEQDAEVPEVVLASGVRVVHERPPPDADAWSSLALLLTDTLAPRLLDTITSSPLCYGATAVVQLATSLEDWPASSSSSSSAAAVPPASVLLPRAAVSLRHWAALAQKATHANQRLARVAGLLDGTPASSRVMAVNGGKGASRRALYALETLASQFAYTAAICAALDHITMAAAAAASTTRSTSTTRKEAAACVAGLRSARWLGALLDAVCAVPSPSTICRLVASRVGLATFSLTARDVEPLRRAYARMVRSASALGHHWLPFVVVVAGPWTSVEKAAPSTWRPTPATQSLSALLPAALLEKVSTRWMACLTENTDSSEDERTSDKEDWMAMGFAVGTLLTSLLETCAASAEGKLLLAPLEPRAAALLRTTVESTPGGSVRTESTRATTLTHTTGAWEAMSKALQCALVRCFSGANEAARGNEAWLLAEATQLDKAMTTVHALATRSAQTSTAHGRHTVQVRLEEEALPPFLHSLSLLTSVMSCAPPPPPPSSSSATGTPSRRVQQLFCAALCEALFEPVTQIAALQAVRALTTSEVGRRCLVHEIAASGEPMARTIFGRVLALTFELLPTLALAGGAARSSPAARARSHSRGSRSPSAQASPALSPRRPLAIRDANVSAEASAVDGGPRTKAPPPATSATRSPVAPRDAEATEDACVVQLGYDVCTLACRAEASLFVPWLLKCRVVERASDLVVLHDLRWRQGGAHSGKRHGGRSVTSDAHVRAHYFFDTPHWARTAARERGAVSATPSPSTARAISADRFTRLMRFLATISLDAEAQRWLFRQAPLLTILLELAGDQRSGEDGVLALLIVRNLCFHAALKTVLCQDLRVLLTLKAVAMGLDSAESLVLAPTDEQSTVASLAAAAVANARVPKRAVDRTDAAAAQTAADAARRKAPVAGALTPELRDFLTTSDRPAGPLSGSPTSSSSLHDWAMALVVRARDQPQRHALQDHRTSARVEDSHRELATRRLHRQSLAVSALWSLLFDHQRGKMYVKRVLSQEPALRVETVYDALPSPDAAAQREMVAAVQHGLEQVQHLCGGAI